MYIHFLIYSFSSLGKGLWSFIILVAFESPPRDTEIWNEKHTFA